MIKMEVKIWKWKAAQTDNIGYCSRQHSGDFSIPGLCLRRRSEPVIRVKEPRWETKLRVHRKTPQPGRVCCSGKVPGKIGNMYCLSCPVERVANQRGPKKILVC